MAIEADSYCFAQVRTGDPDRFFSALFARGNARADLMALYALNLELRQIRTATREMMLAQIRLQWWRESVERLGDGRPDHHPVFQALSSAIARSSAPPPMDLFHALIDAYEAALSSESDLVATANARAKALLALGTHFTVPGRVDKLLEPIEAAGQALGRTMLLRDSVHAAASSAHDHHQLNGAIREMMSTARDQFENARGAFRCAGQPAALPVFLPLALVPLYLDARGAEVALHRRLARLLWAGLRGKF